MKKAYLVLISMCTSLSLQAMQAKLCSSLLPLAIPEFTDSKFALEKAKSGDLSVVNSLLDNNSYEVNTQTYRGNTALMYAFCYNKLRVAVKLLRHPDIKVNLQNLEGDSALMQIAHTPGIDFEHALNFLLEREDIDVNLQDKNGCTALHLAAMEGHAGVVERLLKDKRVKPYVCAQKILSPFLLAVNEGNKEVVKSMLTFPQIDPEWENEDGLSALQLAEDAGREDIASIIKNEIDRRSRSISADK